MIQIACAVVGVIMIILGLKEVVNPSEPKEGKKETPKGVAIAMVVVGLLLQVFAWVVLPYLLAEII